MAYPDAEASGLLEAGGGGLTILRGTVHFGGSRLGGTIAGMTLLTMALLLPIAALMLPLVIPMSFILLPLIGGVFFWEWRKLYNDRNNLLACIETALQAKPAKRDISSRRQLDRPVVEPAARISKKSRR